MKLFAYSLLLLSLTSFAQTIHIQQLDEKFDVKELKEKTGNSAEVKTLKALEKEKNAKELPSSRDVNETLIKAGLETEAKTFDSLDRDQLYLRAGYFSIEELAKLYPKSSKENLKKLIELVLQKKKTGEKK